MNSSLIDILKCPICGSTVFGSEVLGGSPWDIEEGLIWCENFHWFPIQDRVLEFLPGDLAYGHDRIRFEQDHIRELEDLGLLQTEAVATESRTQDQLSPIQLQRQHFDWYAENPDQAYNAYAAMPFWKVVDQRTFAAWNRRIQSERTPETGARFLLDVGCAQGRSSLMVAQPGIHVIGFDISKSMARQAYLNFARVPPGEWWNDFIVADGCHFPFQSGVFDYTLVYGVLHHLPDPAAACREVVRVLKRGGTYFGSENNRTGFRALFDLLQKLIPVWHEEAGSQPLMNSSDFDGWFKDTGLSVETSSTVFVPPHLVNALGCRVGGITLAMSDAVLKAIPILKNHGGLILVEGTKL